MKLFSFFSKQPKKALNKKANPRVITYHFSSFAEELIQKTVQSLRSYGQAAVKNSTSIQNYQQFEQGSTYHIKQALNVLNRFFGEIYSQVLNTAQKALYDAKNFLAQKAALTEQEKQVFKTTARNLAAERRLKLDKYTGLLTQASSRFSVIQADIQRIVEQLPLKLHTERRYVSQRLFIILGILICLLGESMNTFTAFQVLKAPPIVEIPLVVSLTLSSFIFGKIMVVLLKYSSFSTDDEMGFYDSLAGFVLIVGISIGVFTGQLRIDYLEATGTEVSWMVRAFLYLVGVFLFMSSTALTCLLSFHKGEVKNYYARLLVLEKRYARKIAKYSKQIRAIKLDYLEQYHCCKTEHLEKLHFLEEGQYQEYLDKVKEDNDVLNSVLSFSRQYKEQLIHTCLNSILEFRGLAEVKFEEEYPENNLSIPIVDLPDYQLPFEKVESPITPESETITKNQHIMKNNKNAFNNILQPITLWVTALTTALFSLTGCSSVEPQDNVVIHLLDKTAYSNEQYRVTSDDVLEMAGLHQSEYHGLEYHATTVSDLSLSQEYQAILPMVESPLLANSVVRKEEVEAFRTQLSDVLDVLYPDDSVTRYPKTELFSPMKRILNQFRKDDRNITLLLQSDLLENSSNLNFYQAAQQKNSPEEFSSQLAGVLPINLSQEEKPKNIKVIVLYQPTKENDELFQFAYYVFHTVLEEKHGISVELKANL